MEKFEFYRYYLPALMKAIASEDNFESFNLKGPEFYISLDGQKRVEIETYIDRMAGKDSFLDKVSYYFDAKCHGFNEVKGVEIHDFRNQILEEIAEIKEKFGIHF